MEVDPLNPESRLGSRGGLVALIALWLGGAAVLAALAMRVQTPLHFQDEFFFWALAKSIAAGDGLTWRDAPVPLYSTLYPLMIAPITQFGSGVAEQYELVKVFNALVYTAVVFPVYVAARQLVGQGLALLAALLALAAPAANYVGLIGTEVVAYPLAVAALLALAGALATPSPRATISFLILAALSVFARAQFVSLFVVASLALAFVVARAGRANWRQSLVDHKSLFRSLAAILALAIIYLLVRGKASVGIYIGVLQTGGFDSGDIVYWLRAYTADVYLLAGILPPIACFALLAGAKSRREPFVFALAIVALVATIVFVLQMSWFASINTEGWRERGILYERYLIYLGPIYFVGFVAAIGRVSARAVGVSTGIAVFVLAAFPSQAVRLPFSLEAFSQAYLGYLLDTNPSLAPLTGPMLALLAALLGGIFALTTLPERQESARRLGRTIAVTLTLFVLVISQAKAWSYQAVFSSTAIEFAPQPIDWIAKATSEPVAVVAGAGSEPLDFLQPEFWNPNVARVFTSSQAPVASPKIYSTACPLLIDQAGFILPSPGPGCARVPQAWTAVGINFSLRLRDARAVRANSKVPVGDLQIAESRPRMLAMVGGRDIRTGNVIEEMTVRTFCQTKCTLRIRTQSGERAGRKSELDATVLRRVRAGDQLTQFSLPLGSEGSTRVNSIDLREGDASWQRID